MAAARSASTDEFIADPHGAAFDAALDALRRIEQERDRLRVELAHARDELRLRDERARALCGGGSDR